MTSPSKRLPPPLPSSRVRRIQVAFGQLYDFLRRRDRRLRRIRFMIGCPEVEKVHRKTFRIFAHQGHYGQSVCVAGDIAYLPTGELYGILAHELGHIMVDILRRYDKHIWNDQDTADLAWYLETHIPILYRGKLRLEFLEDRDIREIRREAREIVRPRR